jgi:O-antigen ligase
MYLPQILIVFISIAVILLWMRGIHSSLSDSGRANMPSVILAVWIISCAALGPLFYVLHIPGGFDITIERLFFILILSFLVIGLFGGKVRFRNNISIEMLMGIYVMICIVSMIRTGFVQTSPNFPSPWFVFITGYFFPFICFIFAKSYVVENNDAQVIFHALFFFGVYLCITAFFEFYNLKQFVFPRYIINPELGIHLGRSRGPFLNAAVNGVGILIGFICGIHLIEKKSGFTKTFYQALLLLFIPAVFFTLTRSVYLGLLIVLILFLGWYKTSFSKWKLISLPLTIVLIIGIVNSPRLLSKERREGGIYQVEEVESRIALVERSLNLFAEHPFMGVGLAQFIPASIRLYKGRVPFIAENAIDLLQHNHLLGLAVELGAVGLIPYLLIIIMVFRRLMQLAGKLSQTGIIGINFRTIVTAVWCVYLCNNLFIEPSNSLFLNSVPFIFAGIADGLYTRYLESGLNLSRI